MYVCVIFNLMCLCTFRSCDSSERIPNVEGHLHVFVGHHRSLSSGHSCLPKSHSSTQLSLLDKRRSGSCVVSDFIICRDPSNITNKSDRQVQLLLLLLLVV